MPIQKFNKKIGAWVKFKRMSGGKLRITDVKQRNPKMPFKGCKKA